MIGPWFQFSSVNPANRVESEGVRHQKVTKFAVSAGCYNARKNVLSLGAGLTSVTLKSI